MITEIVLFDLPRGMSREEVLDKYRQTTPGWAANPDLVRKYYFFDAGRSQGGGVYVWKSRQASPFNTLRDIARARAATRARTRFATRSQSNGKEKTMLARLAVVTAASFLAAALLSSPAIAADDGVVRVKSAYPLAETIARIKQDVAAKGIRFFDEIDQAKLAAGAGIKVLPSTLLVFGNPPLGTQFLAARPEAGLDWPVRLLVLQDEQGAVWAVYTDFGWIAKRHGVAGAAAQPFNTASGVIRSIAASIQSQ